MSSHNRAREAVQTDTSSEGFGPFGMEERLARRQVFDGPRGLCQATIDDLPDDVVLEIFDFYLDDKIPYDLYTADNWHTLVHVCRWWRSVVFASPRRLGLRLLCGGNRPVRAKLDIWPALPIQIEHHHDWDWNRAEIRLDNMIAALEHPDRVRHMNLFCIPKTWDVLAAAMQVPFPELTYLRLWSYGTSLSVLPGGSTPRLRTLRLECVPFPAVRNLLLSAGDLVDLTLGLFLVPRSGHASLESMVACLSSLKRLELLELRVGSDARPRPDQPGPPPQARAVLPALTTFSFQGMSDYLEDFVARIDTPVLSQLYVSLALDVNGNPVLGFPRLGEFIGRARRLKPSKAARVLFRSPSTRLEFPPRGSSLTIRANKTDRRIFFMAVVCSQLLPLFSLVERLDLVQVAGYDLRVGGRIEFTFFLELFWWFPAIQGLYVSESLVPFIAPALQELVGELATEVLPNLRDVFLGGPAIPESVQEAIQPFLDARQLSGRPIAIHQWGEEEADQ